MYAPYGYKKCGNARVPLPPSKYVGGAKPPEPEKTASDRFPRCRGCPYPRHGLFCWTDSEICLRTEMEEIERKHRRLEALPI